MILTAPFGRGSAGVFISAASDWVRRFDGLMATLGSVPYLSPSDELPLWLSTRPNYNSWQRANLWLLQ